MTNERWGWILVALAAVLIGVLTRAPAVAAKVHDQVSSLAHGVRVASPSR
jgi:cytosine/uracil/thiamine/allantoin permease